MNRQLIILTGADGNLGGKLCKLICDSSDYGVVAVSSFPDRIPAMIEREAIENRDKIVQMSSEEFFRSDLDPQLISGVVHLAFSRGSFPKKDIASSLDYSLAAFKKIVDSGIRNAVYVSSQSVYGDTSEWRTVGMPPAPGSVYAMAKYAGEKLFELCYLGHEELQHAIVRLDFVIQSQNLVLALCKNAKETGVLTLKGGRQVFSYLDAEDVADALFALLRTSAVWKPIYNVGPDHMRYTLLDIADLVKETAQESGIEVTVQLEENDTQLWAGMDSSDFISDTGWTPRYDIREMIRRIYRSV